jgi:integrase
VTTSNVLQWVEEYLAFRHQHGYELKTAGCYLRAFAQFAKQQRHRGPLTLDLITRWVLASRSTNPEHASFRLAVIRPFARYRATIDPATYVPPLGILGRKYRRKPPHIYSRSEIRTILRHAAQLRPANGLRPTTYVAFFSLLFATGLRVSEACNLACEDVDLRQGLLTIRKTKFGKTRFVALHPSATMALAKYSRYRDAFTGGNTRGYFFRTERVAHLTAHGVDLVFSRMRSRLGWTAQGRARQPRLVDARHTFAVRRLQRWYSEGADIGRKMLALSTYLGHTRVTDTYWYLTSVPELMAVASQRFERQVEGAVE